MLFDKTYDNAVSGMRGKLDVCMELDNSKDLSEGINLSATLYDKLIVNVVIPKDDFEGLINKFIYEPGVEPKEIVFSNEKLKEAMDNAPLEVIKEDDEVKRLAEQLAERDRIIENMKADFEKNIEYKQREVDAAYNLCKNKNEEFKQIEKDTNAAVSRLTKERDFLMGLCLDYEKLLGGK